MAAAVDNTPNLTTVTTRLPVDLYKRLKLFCVKHEYTVQEFFTEAIEKVVKK